MFAIEVIEGYKWQYYMKYTTLLLVCLSANDFIERVKNKRLLSWFEIAISRVQ
jgi:hypothetical protein